MKHVLILSTAGLVLLTLVACGVRATGGSANEMLNNPLYAEWYYKDLVEDMMNMEIQNDPITQDEKKKAVIDATRQDALELAKEATKRRQTGVSGHFTPGQENVQGQALLLSGILYLGPDFDAVPGPSLHLYLTTAVDPRDLKFPDPTALDLGVLHGPYGAQAYLLPRAQQDLLYRSVVLWDTKLDRLYGFAQLAGQ